MASFLSKLFGGGKPEANDDAAPARGEAVTYKAFSITASPIRDGEQWRLCGVILKHVAGDGDEAQAPMERTFIRADLYTSREEAETFAIHKGQQIIDEQGDRLFADGQPTGRA